MAQFFKDFHRNFWRNFALVSLGLNLPLLFLFLYTSFFQFLYNGFQSFDIGHFWGFLTLTFLPNPLALLIFLAVSPIRPCFYQDEQTGENKLIKSNLGYLGLLALPSVFLDYLAFHFFYGVNSSPWYEQLINYHKHEPILGETLPLYSSLFLLGLLAFLIFTRLDVRKAPPLQIVFSLSLSYLFIISLTLFSLQTLYFGISFWAYWLLFIKGLAYQMQVAKARIGKYQGQQGLLARLGKLLENSWNWPWLALLLFVPVLAVIWALSLLFGQKPDALIKAWTETADWTFSTKEAPVNLEMDEHYLCTVAANGHPSLVKPLRKGVRHGHDVLVNRQLQIANAFEQVLEEKVAWLHGPIRRFYDAYGYPFASRIDSKWGMDLIYLAMKPLEWFFLLVLYLVDSQPENRIAMQYISPIPEDFKV